MINDPPIPPAAGAATSGPQGMTLAREVLHVRTEWVAAGRVRLRRRIVTETRTLQVAVRREELVVEVKDVAEDHGVLFGTRRDGPPMTEPAPAAPLVIVLQQEVPEVRLHLQPCEQVTVTTTRAARAAQLTTTIRREELDLLHHCHRRVQGPGMSGRLAHRRRGQVRLPQGAVGRNGASTRTAGRTPATPRRPRRRRRPRSAPRNGVDVTTRKAR